ncbi:MAG: hypothetical protein KAW92_10460 [Candidatus Cloacimonetes bacterium]|nr:hypothetical protein [Candidatus Cloacimonadota bacterium]
MKDHMKPNLIDSYLDTYSEISPGKWCTAKPLTLFGIERIRQNIYHAWLVLWGKATAVYFGTDVHKKGKK